MQVHQLAQSQARMQDEPEMKIERPKSLTELVIDELRARIMDGRLPLGAALSESTLASELGLSKTPVREALLQLKADRLVEVLPQRGTYVFRLAPEQVALITELREVLEVAALASAIARRHRDLVAGLTQIVSGMETAMAEGDHTGYRNLDGQFHQTIVDLCGNPYLHDAYSQVGFRIQALRSRLSVEDRLNRLSMKDHRAILKLVKARDIPAAQDLMRAHIDQTRQFYLDVIEQGCAKATVAL